MSPGWEQQAECERERWETTIEALEAASQGVATDEQIRFLARELGINWRKNQMERRA